MTPRAQNILTSILTTTLAAILLIWAYCTADVGRPPPPPATPVLVTVAPASPLPVVTMSPALPTRTRVPLLVAVTATTREPIRTALPTATPTPVPTETPTPEPTTTPSRPMQQKG